MFQSIWIVFVLILSACGGGLHKDPAKDAAPRAAPAGGAPGIPTRLGSDLKLKILPGRADHPELPDFSAEPVISTEGYAQQAGTYTAVRDEKVLISGNQISFEKVVTLFDDTGKDRTLFLVWSEYVGDQRIINAYHSHQDEGPMSEKRFTVRQTPAIYDGEQQMFFAPLLEALDRKSADFDPSLRHTVTLGLTMDRQSRAEVHIQLRVLGTIPKIQAEVVGPNGLQTENYDHVISRVSDDRFIIQSLKIKNPAARPLMIWMRDPTVYQVQIGVDHVYWNARPQEPPTKHLQTFGTESVFSAGEIWVHRLSDKSDSLEKVEKTRLNPMRLEGIRIGSLETLQIDWVLTKTSAVANCILPPRSQRVVLNWATPNYETRSSGGGSGGREGREVALHEVLVSWTPHSVHEDETWSFRGIKISAQRQSEVWLTDPFVKAEEVEAVASGEKWAADLARLPAQRLHSLWNEKSQPISIQAGPLPARFDAAFSCQGVFPTPTEAAKVGS